NRSGRSDLKQPDRFSLQLRKDGAERCVNAKVEIPKSEINKRRLKRPNPRLQPAALGPRLSSLSRAGAAFIDRQPRRLPCVQPLLCLAWIRIFEMLLGKDPGGFTFAPKHKPNAYD
ncbi:hypothetical protein CUMW_024930, partial [Citrus unshiu]